MKALLLAASLAFVLSPATAADATYDLSSGRASFIGSAPLLDGGSDVISFVNLADGSYQFVLTLSSQNIDGLTAILNGQSAPVITPTSTIAFAGLQATAGTPFRLEISGTPAANGLYSGELTVTPVPEAASVALMAAGLGGIGFAGWRARRRRSN